MRWLSVLSALAAAVTNTPLGLATPTTPRWDDVMVVKHSLDSIPAKWQCQGHPPAGTTIDLRVALRPHRENALVDALYEVSNPQHPKYIFVFFFGGAVLSKEEVAELVAPHADTLELVGSWLERHEVSFSVTHGGSWLTLSGVPLAKANALLGASYQLYRHAETDETIVRTTRYALPAALQEKVLTVAPTTYFGSPRALRRRSRLVQNGPTLPNGDPDRQHALATALDPDAPVPSDCSNTTTPACLRQLYKTAKYVPRATHENKLGITDYLEQYASHSDLTKFMTLFRADAKAATFSVEKVNGGVSDESKPAMEANIDIQYAESITYPTRSIFYSTGGSPPFKPDDATPTNTNEPYLEWLEFILSQNQTTIPQTVSASYDDDEQTVPPEYAKSVCDLFAQLGARGVSVLFASGDVGVGEGDCLTNNGSKVVQFSPLFPASCPFVTAVGGTTRVNPEVAANFSGGGFSNYFKRPQYQDGAVSAYLEKIGSKNKGYYDRSGRGYPDISAQATNFQVVFGGKVVSVDGTSCAAPTAAGVISLLNDFLISKGKRPLGFLNPLLYSKAATGFNDITSGSNPGCGTPGFSAMEGWDPVTGLGTPDYLKLQRLVG
ncbi:subtilisin-like protein [Russula compacta]|nr:subtilisin-like protein [Russula compacta]